jgi:hypothetical protein
MLNTKEEVELVDTQTFSTFFRSVNLTNLLIFLGKKLQNFLYQTLKIKTLVGISSPKVPRTLVKIDQLLLIRS